MRILLDITETKGLMGYFVNSLRHPRLCCLEWRIEQMGISGV